MIQLRNSQPHFARPTCFASKDSICSSLRFLSPHRNGLTVLRQPCLSHRPLRHSPPLSLRTYFYPFLARAIPRNFFCTTSPPPTTPLYLAIRPPFLSQSSFLNSLTACWIASASRPLFFVSACCPVLSHYPLTSRLHHWQHFFPCGASLNCLSSLYLSLSLQSNESPECIPELSLCHSTTPP